MRSRFQVLLTLLAVVLATTTLSMTAGAAGSNSFVDDDNSRFEPFIETARDQGLVRGCNPPDNDRVCPHHLVTRGSMAIMLARATRTGHSSANHFTDDNGHVAEAAIDGLVDAGVALGCDKDRICPNRQITRGEMAAMITRAFEWDRAGNPDRYVDLADSPFKEPLAKLAARGGLLACDSPVNERLCPDSTVRRDEAVYALVSVMGLNPARVSSDENSGGPALDFADGFYDLALWDGQSPSSRNRVAITGNGYDNTGLRVGIPEGSHYGADFKLDLANASETPEQLYFRYYLKFDDNWHTTSSGKLPGFSGVYGSSGKGGHQSSPSEPGWSARLMFGPNHTTDDRVDLGYYVYHLGQETKYGDGLGWNEAGKLQAGEWYCLEGGIDMNTPGLADGALRAWVDGTPAFDLSGLEFRRPSEPEIKIESFWFNVYYGGKAVAPQDLGLTIDEVMVDTQRVGCGAGEGASTPTEGDYNGDGYRDRAWWEDCPAGSCFRLRTSGWSGTRTARQIGEGAWFSLDSHRLGMAAGDVDGDGREDIVYHGRCDQSIPCWRVHDAAGDLGDGKRWGQGGRFSTTTTSLTLGDWNRDGLDDLVYAGTCADDDRPCWRVHASSGEDFKPARSWGKPPAVAVAPEAADVNGDGRDDLVYQASCGESECWFAEISSDGSFGKPVALGPAIETTEGGLTWLDYDGDSTSDLVAWASSEDGSWIDVRYLRDLELTPTKSLLTFDRRIEDVAIRRIVDRSTVQTVVELACRAGETCVEHYLSTSSNNLVDSSRFPELNLNRPGGPHIE